MLELSAETEALANRLADQRSLPVDWVVRDALQRQQNALRQAAAAAPSTDVVAARIAAMDRIVAKVAGLPNLDPRSTQEIIDDLNTI